MLVDALGGRLGVVPVLVAVPREEALEATVVEVADEAVVD